MIDIKLEDFERYRLSLIKYGKSLLYNFNPINFKSGELDNISKDLVQETYISFHNSKKDCFVSEEHLYNFLKLCLYRKYQNYISNKRYSYESKKDVNFTDKKLEINENYVCETEENFDSIDNFKAKLKDDQKIILNKLLDGYNLKEIAEQINMPPSSVSASLSKIKKIYLKQPFKTDHRKSIIQLSLNNDPVKEWGSAVEAAQQLDLATSAISNCCKGKRLTHGGFKWKYKENYESTNNKM